MRKDYERIAEIKEEMRAMLDKAEAEKRCLNETEQKDFDSLKNEKALLQMRAEKRSLETEPNYSGVVSGAALFAKAVDDVVCHRSLTDYKGVVSENGIKVVNRSEMTAISSTDAAVPVSVGEVIEPLEKGLILDKLGIKMQSGLTGEFIFPTLQAVEASIAGETATIGDSDLNIGKVKATPKRISVSIPVSRTAIKQTNYDLQNVVLTQISKAVARTLNKWLLSGTKLAGATDGVFVKDTADVTYSDKLSFADVVALETTVMDKGADVTDGTAAYVCTPKVYGALKTTPKEKGSAEMICKDGMINGYPALVSSYVDADTLGFGVFSYSAIGQFGEMDLIIDPYTDAKSNVVNFILNADYDLITARTEAFAIAKKAVV